MSSTVRYSNYQENGESGRILFYVGSLTFLASADREAAENQNEKRSGHCTSKNKIRAYQGKYGLEQICQVEKSIYSAP